MRYWREIRRHLSHVKDPYSDFLSDSCPAILYESRKLREAGCKRRTRLHGHPQGIYASDLGIFRLFLHDVLGQVLNNVGYNRNQHELEHNTIEIK